MQTNFLPESSVNSGPWQGLQDGRRVSQDSPLEWLPPLGLQCC